MKKRKLAIAAALLTLAMNITAYAGAWQQSATGWWYQNDDGTYPANSWQWIDGNNDGVAENYYFNESGYCLMDTITPDGCTVNPSGAQTISGVVVVQAISTTNAIQGTQAAQQEATAVVQKAQTAPVADTVWISETGSKHHSIPNCGRMNPDKATQMSLEKSAGSGYSKCPKCY